MRKWFLVTFLATVILTIGLCILWTPFLWSLLLSVPVFALGFYDFFQKKHSILRNYPVLGHVRWILEGIRPELQQYFIEGSTDGRPFSREKRSVIYQRAKKERDTVPFGTQHDVYKVGYEWVNHSMTPDHVRECDLRFDIGIEQCEKPYNASVLNISAMSFGSLSANAILALSRGAKKGNFAHNTGEGGISPYHLDGGADLIWQVGTGYFGCRTNEGGFCEKGFQKNATRDQVKMIEVKLSQGAKPGHGGILPGTKVTEEIAAIRDVPMGKDVNSPPGHSAFTTPIELMQFLAKLRKLSGGKPVGIKLCIGKRREFIALCKGMLETNSWPDYIAIDGGEGGTGAAPLEFSNRIGAPLVEGLIFAHNVLVGFGLRDRVKLISAGMVSSGFDVLKLLAIGANGCYSARAMMMALGCIQALKCNTNTCPVGVATQNQSLAAGLVPEDKAERVACYHAETVESLCHMMGAMGIKDQDGLKPWHIMRRVATSKIRHYAEIYDYLEEGALLKELLPAEYARATKTASADTFLHSEDVESLL